MPRFAYKAKKDNAQTVSGEVVARDQEEAVDLVSRLGLLPVSVELHEGELSAPGAVQPVRRASVHAFTGQLVRLLKSGLPLLRCLEVLGRQTRDKAMAAVIDDMAANLRNGRSFSTCLKDHPQAFDDVYIALARAGEESGRLRELMASLGTYQRSQEEISRKVRAALTYPSFMFVAGILTVLFILSFVMPRIAVLFDGMKTDLPWPTRVVMGVSHGVRAGWPLLVIVILAGAVAARLISRSPQWRRQIGVWLCGLPLIKDLTVKTDLERFARTMGLLVDSGIPLLAALEIAIPSLQNERLRQELVDCHGRVSGGASFGECLQGSAFIPGMVASLIAVGEESGELGGALRDIADTYEEEIAEATRTATSLLEPLLILAVGLVVGFIVFAMLMPIFQMDMFAR